jgi:hypothetical protein
MRWLCDKSLACSQALPPARVPMFADFRVHGLNKMGEAPPFSFPIRKCSPVVKAFTYGLKAGPFREK